MRDLAETFRYPPILKMHRSRAARIHNLLQPENAVSVPICRRRIGLVHAVAHHLLEGAETAARSRDDELFAWYSTAANTYVEHLESHGRIVLVPPLSSLDRTALSETPYTIIKPGSAPAPEPLKDLVQIAFRHALDAGFQDLLQAHAPVVCLLREKPLTGTFDSWTVTRLPGTVFTDYATEPAVLARDLIHEAGHNWLNDALTADGIKLDDEILFYSPWKQTLRPAFGFLHACWAFPLTMVYTARTIPHVSGRLRGFLDTYLVQQQELLATAVEDHDLALRLIPEGPLQDHLHGIRGLALETAP